MSLTMTNIIQGADMMIKLLTRKNYRRKKLPKNDEGWTTLLKLLMSMSFLFVGEFTFLRGGELGRESFFTGFRRDFKL